MADYESDDLFKSPPKGKAPIPPTKSPGSEKEDKLLNKYFEWHSSGKIDDEDYATMKKAAWITA